jgi:AcrR family transcriptional regulator
VVGDATQTKKRLLEAAADEFAERGMAGARVDRIAQQAGANKALIYSYFGSKEQLFEAVFESLVTTFVESTPITADNLPDYVGRLYDRYEDDPRLLRLAAWYQLERAATAGMPKAAQQANAKKHAALVAAQQQGALTKTFSADALMTIVFGLSSMWAFVKLGDTSKTSVTQRAERRRVAVEAMTRILNG